MSPRLLVKWAHSLGQPCARHSAWPSALQARAPACLRRRSRRSRRVGAPEQSGTDRRLHGATPVLLRRSAGRQGYRPGGRTACPGISRPTAGYRGAGHDRPRCAPGGRAPRSGSPARLPVLGQLQRHTQFEIGGAARGAPVQRGVQVGMLLVEEIEIDALPVGLDGACVFGLGSIELRVAAPDELGLAALVEPFPAVLLDHRQLVIAGRCAGGPAAGRRPPCQVLLDQGRQPHLYLVRGHGLCGGSLCGGSLCGGSLCGGSLCGGSLCGGPPQRACAACRVKPPLKTDSRRQRRCSASGRRSWLHSMAPRSVCWRRGASARRSVQDVKPVGRHLGQHHVRRLIGDTRRGQLDSQRQPVEQAAKLRYRPGVFKRQLKLSGARLAALHKQLHGLIGLEQRNQRVAVGGQVQQVGTCQRRHVEDMLPAQIEDNPTGDQRLGARRSAQQTR